ncbi:MAG TPA: HlyD family secretion protein [bacterium]|nr:HlyD family secretion protein [bacterium]
MADEPVEGQVTQIDPGGKRTAGDAVRGEPIAPPAPARDGARANSAAGAAGLDAGLASLRPRWRTQRIVFIALAAIVLVLIGAAVAYWRMNAGLVKTDNAQTGGDIAPISARISGIAVAVDVNENDVVKAGTVLVELDPTDDNLALAEAKAQLAAARAQVEAMRAALAAQGEQFRTAVLAARAALQATAPHLPQAQAQLRMSDQTTPAQIAQARAQVTTAQANVQAAKSDLDTAARTTDRDRMLLAQGAISAQQVDTDTATFESAKARYQAAQDGLRQARDALVSAEASREQVAVARQNVEVQRGQISQAQAQVEQAAAGGALVQQKARELAVAEANVANAAAAVAAAEVNLGRTKIRAPENGWVTNRTVEIGQVVQPNQPLLSLTLAHHIWVVANIKETQLGAVRVGEPVRVTIDAFRRRAFHGTVESIGSTTGSATALLPPDNATGNFVKVVQLVPVRVALILGKDDPPLQIGLSCEVAIDTRPGVR